MNKIYKKDVEENERVERGKKRISKFRRKLGEN